MKRIAIFASGSGSNAQRIAEYFKGSQEAEVSLILTNNPQAGVIERARKLNIPVVVFNKNIFYKSGNIVRLLKDSKTDLVVLAGFMMLIPEEMVKAFPDRIVNIHPALLPKYGGKGMYGHFVHEAVVAAKDPESGITIHYVDERYDEGAIIFQATCQLEPTDTPETVAAKVQQLEHDHFPKVIHQIL